MRMCFATEKDSGLDGVPYPHFGSAPFFVLCETDTGEVRTIRNRDEHHSHGACNPINALNGERIDAVVVGGIGARAISKLNAMGISVYRSGDGTIRDNIESFKNGTLIELTPGDSCGHHGRHGGCGDGPLR